MRDSGALHCPRCGDVLAERGDGRLECLTGRMPIGEALEAQLRACYVERSRRPVDGSLQDWVGGDWFCPGCGSMLNEFTPGDLRCPVCGEGFAEFIPALSVLPHAGGSPTRT